MYVPMYLNVDTLSCRVCGGPSGTMASGAMLVATPSSEAPTALERRESWQER